MYATEKTSSQLKDAGFPQPNPVFGQAWYLEGDLGIVTRDSVSLVVSFQSARTDYVSRYLDLSGENAVFAPTEADILAQLPGLSVRRHGYLKEWQARYKRGRINLTAVHSDNATEACADAWFNRKNYLPTVDEMNELYLQSFDPGQ